MKPVFTAVESYDKYFSIFTFSLYGHGGANCHLITQTEDSVKVRVLMEQFFCRFLSSTSSATPHTYYKEYGA